MKVIWNGYAGHMTRARSIHYDARGGPEFCRSKGGKILEISKICHPLKSATPDDHPGDTPLERALHKTQVKLHHVIYFMVSS